MKTSFPFIFLTLLLCLHSITPEQTSGSNLQKEKNSIEQEIQVPVIPPQTKLLQFSQPKGLQASSQDKTDLLWNIQQLTFLNPTNCGPLKITNQSSSSDVIKMGNSIIMAATNFKNGRAISLASQHIFKENSLNLDKNWVFLLRNIIKWVTKNKYDTYQILAIGIQPSSKFKQLLRRSGIQTSFTFAYDLLDISNLSPSKYNVILLGELTLQYLKQTDAQKIIQYVQNGGGIVGTFLTQCYGCYSQLRKCSELKKQCLHNKIFNPMGIKFDDTQMVQVSQLQFSPSQTMELSEKILRNYERSQPIFDSYSNPFEKFSEDYKKIISGVEKFTYGGAAFNSFQFSNQQYFPVTFEEKQATIIAGRFGQGKLFFAGHGTIFSSLTPGNLKLFSNVVRWMKGSKTTYKVGFLFDNSFQNYPVLEKIPEKFQKFTVNNPSQLQGKDILLIKYFDSWPAKLTSTMLQQIKNFVKSGGNIVFASPGWIWSYYGQGSRNKSLQYDLNFANLAITKKFNVYLNENEGELSDGYKVRLLERNIDLQNFLQNDLLEVLNGKQSFESQKQTIQEIIKRIRSEVLFSNICDVDLYHFLVDAFVESRFNLQKNVLNTLKDKDTQNNVYLIMNALSYAVDPIQCRALPPALNKYPGYAKNKISSRIVKVFRNAFQRVYTGLYINPGEAIRIKHGNSSFDVTTIQLAINHGDPLYGSDNGRIQRFPQITHTTPIKSNQFIFASPHGGIIFFIVKSKNNSTLPLVFQIEGAYEAPFFNQKLHTAENFIAIQKIQAPFYVFETSNMVLIGPTNGIFGSIIINPKTLINYWNTVIKTYKNFRGIPFPFEKESMFSDIRIASGGMHSGNPVMTFQEISLISLGWKNQLYKIGHWGIYHEFGHLHSDGKWTTDVTGQVTCNIFSLLLYKVMHGKSVFQNQWFVGRQYQKLLVRFSEYLSLSNQQKLPVYGQDSQLGLYFYAILIEDFGFESFSALHKRYDQIKINLTNDQQKYELLVQQLSKIVKKNLWKYFYNWGMPVTQASKKNISSLPEYICKRHPELTE